MEELLEQLTNFNFSISRTNEFSVPKFSGVKSKDAYELHAKLVSHWCCER